MAPFIERNGTLGQSQYLLEFNTVVGKVKIPVFALMGSNGQIISSDSSGGIATSRTWFLDHLTDSVSAFQGTNPWVVQQSSVASSVTAHLDKDISVSATTTARATAAAPSYSEGVDSPISQDLNGNLRTLATVNIAPGSTFSVTQSSGSSLTPWYVKQSDIPWIVNQTTSVGVSALQAGSWTVGRNWSLTSAGDAVLVHLDAPITIGQTPVTQVTSPWVVQQSSANSSVLAHLDAPFSISSVSVNNFPASQNVIVTNSVGVSALQAGAWTTGRTWTLTSANDSVLAHIDNFPATQAVSGSLGRTWTLSDPSDVVKVNQGTSPWVVTQGSVGTVLVTQGTSPWLVNQTTSVGVFAQQAGSWIADVSDRSARLLGVITSITQSVGVSASIVGQPVSVSQSGAWSVTRTNSAGGIAEATVIAVGADQSYAVGTAQPLTITSSGKLIAAGADVPGTSVPSYGFVIAGSAGQSFTPGATTGVTQFVNVTKTPLQGTTTSTGGEFGLATRSRLYYGNKSTYAAGMATGIAAAVAAGTTTNIAYLFHPTTDPKRYQLNRIRVTLSAMSVGTSFSTSAGMIGELLIGRITAENATPGGVLVTTVAHDQADAATSSIVRRGATGAPTRAAGFIRDTIALGGTGAFEYDFDFTNIFEGKPPILRSGTAEGWEVTFKNVQVVPTGGTSVGCTFVWTEETATPQ